MATNTVERKIELTEAKSIQKMMNGMEREAPKTPFSDHPYTTQARERTLRIFNQCFTR